MISDLLLVARLHGSFDVAKIQFSFPLLHLVQTMLFPFSILLPRIPHYKASSESMKKSFLDGSLETTKKYKHCFKENGRSVFLLNQI